MIFAAVGRYRGKTGMGHQAGVGGAIDPDEYARLVDACRARTGKRSAAATA